MGWGKGFLGAGLAAGALFAASIPALATAFSVTVSNDCLSPGSAEGLSITGAPAGAVISARITFPTGTTTTGVVNALGSASSQGAATMQVTIPSTAHQGMAQVAVLVLGGGTAQVAFTQVQIDTTASPCSSSSPTRAVGSSLTNVGVMQVKKTCDTGVSGNAVFSASVSLGEGGVFQLPSVTAPCNGSAVSLPALPASSEFRLSLHEATVPTGGVAAADQTVVVSASAGPVTIHNAKAAAVSTPTPTPRAVTLPRTGGGDSTTLPGLWFVAIVGALLILLGGLGLQLRSKS